MYEHGIGLKQVRNIRENACINRDAPLFYGLDTVFIFAGFMPYMIGFSSCQAILRPCNFRTKTRGTIQRYHLFGLFGA
jgi:hypothetical protein